MPIYLHAELSLTYARVFFHLAENNIPSRTKIVDKALNKVDVNILWHSEIEQMGQGNFACDDVFLSSDDAG